MPLIIYDLQYFILLTVSLYITYKLYARNTSMLTLVGFNDDQLDVTKLPDVLNCHSEVQLHGCTHAKIFSRKLRKYRVYCTVIFPLLQGCFITISLKFE